MKRACALLLAGLLAGPRAQDSSAYSSEQGTFVLAAGFESNLFASEAEGLENPVQIRFDARGRLWVACAPSYPHPAGSTEPDDRIVLLEDANHDTRADRATVFARGLRVPTGLEVLADGSGCVVGQGTELLLLRDRDGDGRADSSEPLLRGFGTRASAHAINSFRAGPLGDLWFFQGALATSRVETLHGLVAHSGPALWRWDARARRLQASFIVPGVPANPRGLVFDPWGAALVLDAEAAGVFDPTLPGRPANLWPAGRKAAAGERVETAHFPPEWQGRVLVAGYLDHSLGTLSVAEHGAGFTVAEEAPLLTSSHDSFRPVDLRFGPEGALYVCDWFNPVLRHDAGAFSHPDRDTTHGRIWRIVHRERALTPVRDLTKESPRSLCGLLDSPDGWTRTFAFRLLAEARAEDVMPAVQERTAAGRPDLGLARALAVAAAQGRLAGMEDGWKLLRESESPGARAFAADLHAAAGADWPDAAALLLPLAADPYARVRVRALSAAAALSPTDRLKLALAASELPPDPHVQQALARALEALPAGDPPLQPGIDRLRRRLATP